MMEDIGLKEKIRKYCEYAKISKLNHDQFYDYIYDIVIDMLHEQEMKYNRYLESEFKRDIKRAQYNIPMIIAGPCAIENIQMMEMVAEILKKNNIKYIRGGAYKSRTSPYDFQGLKREGIEILNVICKRYNLYSVSEIVDPRDIEFFVENIDIIQIGARNMQNYELLKEVGKTNKTVLLKNGLTATIEEFIYAAEYIALEGNKNVILCERGIRTSERKTRNTLDVSAIPILKQETEFPVIADLSHSLGRKDIVNVMGKAVLAAGADGIMLEIHPSPEKALSDSKQQLTLSEFEIFLREIRWFLLST